MPEVFHDVMKFLSTPSARRATAAARRAGQPLTNFYPRPPRGGRPGMPRPLRTVCGISIHALREEGDMPFPAGCSGGEKISIHALREEGDMRRSDPKRVKEISIHALREEGDWCVRASPMSEFNFYPRPPRGGRLDRQSVAAQILRFLSTPSARRATAKTETKSLFSNKLYNILHEFRRALIYNGSKSYPNHAK